MPAGKPPFVGIGWDIGIGWYAWFGRPPYVVRVPLKLAEKPLKVAAKPLKAAGRFMAANPIIISGVIIVGLAGALIRHEMTLDISEDQISEIRNQLGINGDDRNIAVCGRVSTGKSAFVNAIRGLLPTSVDAAPIGNEETTTEMTPYRDPHLPAVVWWDIPGAGGQNSREWHYCSEQCLFAFDQVIIVHDQVFSQTECNIYRSCIEIGKEVLIVRTQSDNNMSRIRMENPELEGLSLVNRYVSESIRATESFLDNANLPKPRALYHITAQLLTRARDRSHIISAHPFLQNIDELPLLMKLGIPSIGETDGEGDTSADEFEGREAFSDGGTDED
ncbi:hypothetical protein KXW49_006281 [Aspergillus fumigatus]|nr:hypothetical protein KXW49_006281 [Aspergillus fumigatus]